MHRYWKNFTFYVFFCSLHPFFMQSSSLPELFYPNCESAKNRIYYQNHTDWVILLSEIKSSFKAGHLL